MKIVINNLVAEYDINGEGKTILFLHGWGVDLHSFDKLVDELKGKYRIIRLDLPGFGGTTTPTKWKLDDYVDFVREFVYKADVEPSVLLGHSFGGRIIIKGVGGGKLKAKKIILISPAGVSLFNLKKFLIRVVSKVGKLLLYIPPVYFWKESIRKKFYKGIGSEYLDNREMREIFGSVVSEDLAPYADNINSETLLIWGEKDLVTPLSDGKFLKNRIKNSKLEILQNSGHFSFVEEPKKVAQLIEGFMM